MSKNTLEQVRQEITSAADRERSQAQNVKKYEEETRAKFEQAQVRKAAALESGDLEAFKAAGLEAESLRLELEFIEQRKQKEPKPGADAETDKRIAGALRAEAARIRADAVAQLRQIFQEAQDVSAEAVQQLNGLNKLLSDWDSVVMHRQETHKIANDSDMLMFAQIGNGAKAEIYRFEHIRGC